MDINTVLKEKFENFCKTYYRNRKYEIGKKRNNDDGKWFYIQVGNYFKDHFHIEYIDLNGTQGLQFHIEFSKDEININKIFYKLLLKVEPDIANRLKVVPQEVVLKKTSEYCLWFDIKDTENISTKEDLFKKISEYMKIFDSAIDRIFFYNFKQPKEINTMNIILTQSKNNNEILQYFFCSIDKDENVFSCTQNEIAENAFKNDKTLNIFQDEIKDNTDIIINKSAFENCAELKAVLYFLNNNSGDEDQKNTSLKDNITDTKDLLSENGVIDIKNLLPVNNISISIQYHAFKDCENLHTIVLPEFSSIEIEKEAFESCKKIRSVVLVENDENSNVSISDEAFSNCADITFICKKDGKVARYAREHNFRIVSING